MSWLPYEMSLLELAVFVTGLLGVWFSTRQWLATWPVALLSVCLAAVLYYQARLYADMGLQAVYFVLCIYGWVYWKRPGTEGQALVMRTPFPWLVGYLLLGELGALVGGYSLAHYTNADLPWWDAHTTSYSLVAQWLMSRKRLEHWLLWMVIDLTAMGMYVYKELYLLAGQFAVFTLLAVYGYAQWRQSQQQITSPAYG